MVSLQQVYADIDEHNAKIIPYSISFSSAATIEYNHEYGIFVDFSRMKTISDITYALIHEVGHCATGCTHQVSSPLDLVEKHEYKANRWAIERYLPLELLNKAIKCGITECWELAEYFNLPEQFIKKALYYWTECRGADFNKLAG